MVSMFELNPIHATYCLTTRYFYNTGVQNGIVPQGPTRLSCAAITTLASWRVTAWAQNTAISTSSERRELRISLLQHAEPQPSRVEILRHNSGGLGQSEPPRIRLSGTRERTLHCSSRSCMSYQPHQHQRRDRDRTMQYLYPLCLPQSPQKLAKALPRKTNPSISRTSSAH